MAVTEIASASGEWNLTLKDNTPLEVLDQLGYFGHIAISAARVDPVQAGDALLSDARYVGVLRNRTFGDKNKTIKGAGMALWLGDEDNKGHTIELPITFVNSTFSQAIQTLLPASVAVGQIFALPGLYNGTHVFTSRREAIDYVCSFYNAEWRIRGNGQIDAGSIANLYNVNPSTAILRKRSGLELDYKAFSGQAKLDSDVKDFTTRVLLLAEGAEASTVSATASINPALNPFKDLFGNSVVFTRVISETTTAEGNASARAQLQLNRFTSPRDSLKLSTSTYDLKGDIKPGDYVWVYDPDAKLTDLANPIDFYGQEIHPLKLRLFQMTWPIVKGMGVSFRTDTGVWLDLTDYVEWEDSDTDLVVGGYNRSLTGVGGSTQDPGSRPTANSTTPGVVTWNQPFRQGTYQSNEDGLTRAQVVLEWNQPLNTDGSVITDGFAYEICWRTGEIGIWPTRHVDMAVYQHQNLVGNHSSPIPFTTGAFQYTQVSWGNNQFLMLDLTPGIPYDFQIRAIDSGTPPNYGAYSAVAAVQTQPDTASPSTPASPQSVAGSRNAVQIVHTLGKASGGTYNLEADLNHLQIHSGFEPDYLTSNVHVLNGGTLLGKLAANQGMMRGKIPAVGSFQLDDQPDKKRFYKVVAVDNFGNQSSASAPMEQTAELIDSAFISNLTVSRVSAGIVQANWVQAAEFSTAETGARVVFAWYGIEVFNLNNLKTLDIDSATGGISMVGQLSTGVSGSRVVIGTGGFPEIRFFTVPGGESNTAFINSFDDFDSDIGLGLNSGSTNDLAIRSIVYLRPDNINLVVAAGELHPSFPNQRPIGGFIRLGLDDIRLNVRTGQADLSNEGGTIVLTRTLGSFSRVGTGLGSNFFQATSDGPKIGVDGINVFAGRRVAGESWVEAGQWAGFSRSRFRGKLDGGAGGDNFSVRVDGNANAILDVDGKVSVFVKNFIINHPEDDDKWLVHSCTETPEAAVEYSGHVIAQEWGELIEVKLPGYFESATLYEHRQVWLQPMLNAEADLMMYMPRAIPSYPREGKFYITTDAQPGSAICWKVKAVRSDVKQFAVEPNKNDHKRMGTGPYTWLEDN